LLNAEHFSGKSIYFDDYAPRILSQVIAVVWKLTGISEIVARLISVLISVGLVMATYLVAKEFFNKRVALFASLFLLLNPLFMLYSSIIYTDIPLALLITLAIYFFYTGLVKNKPINLLLFGVFTAISALIKYPGLLLYPITLSFVLLSERKALKNPFLWLSYVISLVLLIPSANQFSGGIAMQTAAFPYLEQIKDPYYFINLPFILLTATPLIILHLVKKRTKLFEKRHLIFLLIIFFVFGFYQTVSRKDIRYLLPLFPAAFVLAGKELDELIMEKIPESFEKIRINFKKVYGYFFLLPLVASLIALYSDFYLMPHSLIQASRYLSSVEDSLIISNCWPEVSYYSQKTAKWFPRTEENLHQQMREFKIDYVVVVEIKGYWFTEPDWAKIKNLDSLQFLTKVQQFEDNGKVAAIYKFNEDVPNRTLVNVTDKSSLAELLPI
jgi:hypothetical protein